VLAFPEAAPLERYLVDQQAERSEPAVSGCGDRLQHAGGA
jgi:hypothetical protein